MYHHSRRIGKQDNWIIKISEYLQNNLYYGGTIEREMSCECCICKNFLYKPSAIEEGNNVTFLAKRKVFPFSAVT